MHDHETTKNAAAAPAYADTRLAAVYDALNPASDDFHFHRGVVGPAPMHVLDIGCGTGRFAVELARAGHDVTGVDPAQGMLAVARTRPGGDAVRWIASDAATLDLGQRFDRIVMTGHVFQVFLDDAATVAALEGIARHLAPEGLFSFETRNPGFRAWEGWTADRTRETVMLPHGGTVEVCYDVTGVAGDIVTYETRFRFDDGTERVSVDRLRFVDAAALHGLLARAGLAAAETFGDWDRSPLVPGSPEIIIIAARR